MLLVISDILLFFFFKQKTAYDVRISDWSSDVCSSDLSIGEQVPGYEVRIWYGLMAPAKTPDAVVARLNQALVAAVGHPDMARQMREQGYERAVDTPEAMDREVRADVKKWGDVIKKAGIRSE